MNTKVVLLVVAAAVIAALGWVIIHKLREQSRVVPAPSPDKIGRSADADHGEMRSAIDRRDAWRTQEGEPGLMTAMREVAVANPGGIYSVFVRRTLDFGDTCWLKERSALTKMAVSGDEVLVRYDQLGRKACEAFDCCPDATLFFVPVKDFVGMAKRYREAEAKKQHVRELLGGQQR
ncbi:hypothetical protein A3C96_01870 [Candidatus Uhrbacteria bacterium RIFCSPHIGHO2_02_FULL_60_10]|uniref:Uncharacterized protein n=1 Tax=Candidatus Uhrbacteria bacterium RIFCSPHIGHO2_02_FULL_60_10 TaxID=1802392 RepID=A0A1F7U8U6_9BACT|nr:MAG: hypothetical protein A3C96_01870 [Candidatus Uhrbacteria bacterium RIFCSPHIGHO2_02_FULL_60_10]